MASVLRPCGKKPGEPPHRAAEASRQSRNCIRNSDLHDHCPSLGVELEKDDVKFFIIL
jgi:hypothetical protein